MNAWEVVVYGTIGIFIFIGVVYVASRVGSVGYFRTRSEYDRSLFDRHFNHKGNGENDGERQ